MPVHSLRWMTDKQWDLQRRKLARSFFNVHHLPLYLSIHASSSLLPSLFLFLPLSLLSASVSSSPANHCSAACPIVPCYTHLSRWCFSFSLFTPLSCSLALFFLPPALLHGNRKQHISMGQMSADPVLISEVKWGKMGA